MRRTTRTTTKAKAKGKAARRRAGAASLRARRFTSEERADAVRQCLEAEKLGEKQRKAKGLTREQIAGRLNTTPESLRKWVKAIRQAGPPQTSARQFAGEHGVETVANAVISASAASNTGAPALGPGGLAPVEVEAILELKKKHPSMGPAQIRAQLKRFRGWRIATRAIDRVLRQHGYRAVHIASRPEGAEYPQSWEAPRRNSVWQMDFAEVRIGPERRFVLFILDDYSRYLVAATLCEAPSSEVAVGALRDAVALHGRCDAVYTDRGGAFLAWRDQSSFQAFLEQELIDHHVSKPYKPQGRGKVEAVIGTLRRELWDVQHFESVEVATAALSAWVRHYNEGRAHMALDGLTPADRFFGRGARVQAALAARVRDRVIAETGPSEEGCAGAPVEVLRIVLVDGHAELRVFGARVPLGRLG